MKQQGVTGPNPDVGLLSLAPLAHPCGRAKGVRMKQQGVTDPKPDASPQSRTPLHVVVPKV
jgi:hypothetical protein